VLGNKKREVKSKAKSAGKKHEESKEQITGESLSNSFSGKKSSRWTQSEAEQKREICNAFTKCIFEKQAAETPDEKASMMKSEIFEETKEINVISLADIVDSLNLDSQISTSEIKDTDVIVVCANMFKAFNPNSKENALRAKILESLQLRYQIDCPMLTSSVHSAIQEITANNEVDKFVT